MSVASVTAGIIGTFLLLSVSTGALAQDHAQAFIAAQKSFELGRAGSKKDSEQAAEQFKGLTGLAPGNPLYLAYYGSTLTIMARDAYLPWNKLKLGEQGLGMIDKALRMLGPEHDTTLLPGLPLNLGTRLVAISTFLKVPDTFFHRYDAGRKLLAETMKSTTFQVAPAHIQAEFHAQAAQVAQKGGQTAEETVHLRRVLELEKTGKIADAARIRLGELGL